MMKRLRWFFFCLLTLLISHTKLVMAQSFSNQWIDYGQTYYKIPVANTGFYRLSYNWLSSNGFPVNADPRRFQMWHRGKQISIRISNPSQSDASIDGVFDPNEFIEFYGQKNDGWQDYDYYQNPTNLLNRNVNLFNDTSAYFLTVSNNGTVFKRMQSPQAFNNISGAIEINYYQEIQERVYADMYYETVPSLNSTARTSWGVSGEGWAGFPIERLITGTQQKDQTYSEFFNVDETNPAFSPNFHLRMVNPNSTMTGIQINVRNTNFSNPVFNFNAQNFRFSEFNGNFNQPSVLNNGSSVEFQFKNNVNGSYGLVYFAFKYCRNTAFNNNLSQRKIVLYARPSGNFYLKTTNIPSGSLIYNLNNPYEPNTVSNSQVGNQHFINLEGTSADTLMIVNNNQYLNPIALQTIQFTNINPTIDHYMIITHPAFLSGANAYAQYRSSQEGGAHGTKVLRIEEVYNQFGYGEASPIAIRNLVKWLHNQPSNQKRFMLLIGQGFVMNHVDFRFRKGNTPAFALRMPTLGVPVSDLLLTQIYHNQVQESEAKAFYPVIPIGRLSVSTNQEIENYLQKVKDHELPLNRRDPAELWRKSGLFLSGGNIRGQIDERPTFKIYVQAISQQATDEYVGIQPIYKVRSLPGVNLGGQNIDIVSEVNKGTSLIYSFGHTAARIIDVNYGRPNDPFSGYNNLKKYPVQYVAGCQSGDVFSDLNLNDLVSKDWLFTERKGSVAFLGNTSIAYDETHSRFSRIFMQKAYKDTNLLDKSIGEILACADTSYIKGFFSPIYASLAHTMLILGDPAVKLFNPKYSDFLINDGFMEIQSHNGTRLTALSDSIQIKLRVVNLGAFSLSDKAIVKIQRIRSNGQLEKFNFVLTKPIYADTILRFNIPNSNPGTAFGNNTFQVCINEDRLIREYEYNNNCAQITQNIPFNTLKILQPAPYSILKELKPNFFVQANQLQTVEREYTYEIDTSYLFNSAVKITGNLRATSQIRFDVSLNSRFNPNDSTVFYWRIKFKTFQNNDDTAWTNSSFIYINNSFDGWSQKPFPQFLESSLNGLSFDINNRKIDFSSTLNRIDFIVKANSSNEKEQSIRINGRQMVLNNLALCNYTDATRNAGVHAITIDANSFFPYIRNDIPMGRRYYCEVGNEIAYFYNINNDAETQTDLQNYISNARAGEYVVLSTWGNPQFSKWSAGLKSVMASAGSTLLSTMGDLQPYIFVFRKGFGKIDEFGPDLNLPDPTLQTITKLVNIQNQSRKGSLTSTFIGPSFDWKNFTYELQSVENHDVWDIEIWGSELDFSRKSMLFKGKPTSGSNLNSIIPSVNQYPYLQLKANVADSIQFSSPKIKRWEIAFSPTAEGSLVFDRALGIDTSTYRLQSLTAGIEKNLTFGFSNLSTTAFRDSLLIVRFSILNLSSNSLLLDSIQIKAPAPGKTTLFSYVLKTNSLDGQVNMQVFVNPRKIPEQNYDNNLYNLPLFTVNRDIRNPSVDVTFDGSKILDGDIVSPNPIIQIMIRDDNAFLLKTDTTGIDVFLKSPCSNLEICDFRRISFQSKEAKFYPQVAGSQQFRVELNPANLSNGRHCLKVQASDASGNLSAIRPYGICFEVIQESSITHFFPYPNPFSSKTQFVFTLTGSKIPSDIKIQIMTISGKVVKEIFKEDLGPLRIGHNVSQYAWDGYDDFGDKLANGVYLYKVITKLDGDDIAKRQTSADQYFKQGFGKLYIMR